MVDMSESLHRKLSVLAARTGRKKVDQSADAARGWVGGGGGVRIIGVAEYRYEFNIYQLL
jgi:hypothetical protein